MLLPATRLASFVIHGGNASEAFMMATLEFDVPTPGNTIHLIVDDKIVFVSVDYDPNPLNPLEDFDGVGRIIQLRRSTPQQDIELAENALANDPDAVELSYYEHGSSLWYVRERGGKFVLPDRHWDGVDRAGVWLPDKSVLDSAETLGLVKGSKERRKWMLDQAENACRLFTAYLNGDVFGYSVAVYRVRHDDRGEPYDRLSDYRRDEPIYEDERSGFFETDYMEEQIREAVRVGLEAA